MLIYLIGPMGSGKTTISKALAGACDMDWFDTDQLVEEHERMSINDIFENKGELYFRLAESRILNQIRAQLDHAVIATGGGLPCFDDNIGKLKSSGKTIYLKASAATLARRLYQERDIRPMLKEATTISQIEEKITNQLIEREPYYGQADYTVNANLESQDVVVTIKSILEEIDPSSD